MIGIPALGLWTSNPEAGGSTPLGCVHPNNQEDLTVRRAAGQARTSPDKCGQIPPQISKTRVKSNGLGAANALSHGFGRWWRGVEQTGTGGGYARPAQDQLQRDHGRSRWRDPDVVRVRSGLDRAQKKDPAILGHRRKPTWIVFSAKPALGAEGGQNHPSNDCGLAGGFDGFGPVRFDGQAHLFANQHDPERRSGARIHQADAVYFGRGAFATTGQDADQKQGDYGRRYADPDRRRANRTGGAVSGGLSDRRKGRRDCGPSVAGLRARPPALAALACSATISHRARQDRSGDKDRRTQALTRAFIVEAGLSGLASSMACGRRISTFREFADLHHADQAAALAKRQPSKCVQARPRTAWIRCKPHSARFPPFIHHSGASCGCFGGYGSQNHASNATHDHGRLHTSRMGATLRGGECDQATGDQTSCLGGAR